MEINNESNNKINKIESKVLKENNEDSKVVKQNTESSLVKKKKKQKIKVKYIKKKIKASDEDIIKFNLSLAKDYLLYLFMFLLVLGASVFLFYMGFKTPDPKITYFIFLGIVGALSVVMSLICLFKSIFKKQLLTKTLYKEVIKPKLSTKNINSSFKYNNSQKPKKELNEIFGAVTNKHTIKVILQKLTLREKNTKTTCNSVITKNNVELTLFITKLKSNFPKIYGENGLPKNAVKIKSISSGESNFDITSPDKNYAKNILNGEITKSISRLLNSYKEFSLYIYKNYLLIVVNDNQLFNLCEHVKVNREKAILSEIGKLTDFIGENFILVDQLNSLNLKALMPKPKQSKKK